MKTYIKPNTIVTNIELQNQLLSISGTGEQKQGTSNGEYVNDETITLGSRHSSVWDEEEEEEE